MPVKLNKKDLQLLKSAIRRAFARSDLHREVLEEARVIHSDPSRPKVKGWRRCAICGKPEAQSYFVVDHISPVQKINEIITDLDGHLLLDRIYCHKNNLQAVDETCHKLKSNEENAERRKFKKGLSNGN